jgi:hypothetical protein
VSITNYFHSDGYLAEGRFKHDVEKLLVQYEQLESRTAEESKKLRWAARQGRLASGRAGRQAAVCKPGLGAGSWVDGVSHRY